MMNKWVLLLLAAVLSMPSCSKKPKADESTLPSAANADENLGDSDHGNAMGLQSVNFAYDAYVLDAKAKEVLKANAQILKDKGSLKIQVEGHCDARGGIQYNVALGEKRANSVKKFLSEQGITTDRISVISFGKEKLLENGSTDEAHAKNRRANFVVTSR
jgi:peptidoglycan-associated lipoprotein